jgi:hypothetical protein
MALEVMALEIMALELDGAVFGIGGVPKEAWTLPCIMEKAHGWESIVAMTALDFADPPVSVNSTCRRPFS